MFDSYDASFVGNAKSCMEGPLTIFQCCRRCLAPLVPRSHKPVSTCSQHTPAMTNSMKTCDALVRFGHALSNAQ